MIPGIAVNQKYPELFSFSTRKDISLQKTMEDQDLEEHFHRPLSTQAYSQFLQLQTDFKNRQPQNQDDIWHLQENSPHFSSMKVYKNIIGPTKNHHIFKHLWHWAARLRHKIFFWLLLHDRVNTTNLLKRKSMHLQSYNYVLCYDNVEETLTRLLWDCPFALRCWKMEGPQVLMRSVSWPNSCHLRLQWMSFWWAAGVSGLPIMTRFLV